MPRCTMPYIPKFRNWFNDRFGDLCDIHDFNYKSRYNRKLADIELAAAILIRGYPLMAMLTYIFTRTIGYIEYNKPIWKERFIK